MVRGGLDGRDTKLKFKGVDKMSKKKISCFITVDSKDLEELCKGKSVKNYKFVDKTIFRHGDGFVTNVVIFLLTVSILSF